MQHRENGQLAKALIEQATEQQLITPKVLTLHADRRAPQRAKPVAFLLADLGITKTHSRPYTSSDNPYSEAHFKTLKYRPEFPERFDNIEHARGHCRVFFDWYNHQHRHSGIGLMTPAAIHFGQAPELHTARARVLDAAYDLGVPPVSVQGKRRLRRRGAKYSDRRTAGRGTRKLRTSIQSRDRLQRRRAEHCRRSRGGRDRLEMPRATLNQPRPRGGSSSRRRAHQPIFAARRTRRRVLPYVAIVGAAAAAVVVVVIPGSAARGDAARRVVEMFASSWQRGSYGRMYALLTPTARRRESLARFAAAYDTAARAATTQSLATGVPQPGRGGGMMLAVDVHTQLFGTIGGTIRLRLIETGNGPRISWTPAACFPGLRGTEQVTRIMVPSRRGSVLAANGQRLSAGPSGSDPLGAAGETIAGIVGRPTAAQRGAGITSVGITGLERDYNEELAGRLGAELLLGRRVIAALRPHAGTTIGTTIEPRLQQAAVAALGARLGGIAVVAPSSGDILALAGLALSSAQPPGSSFKIITASAALRARLTTPARVYPVASAATLDGFTLRNANGEACGGSLIHAFAVSCNSVLAPLE